MYRVTMTIPASSREKKKKKHNTPGPNDYQITAKHQSGNKMKDKETNYVE